MKPWLIRHVIFPIGARLTRPGVLRKLCFLEASQSWPPERLHALQCEKLQRLMQHVYQHVPYYRRLFDEMDVLPADICEPEDLSKLPPLTKQDIRANLSNLLATNVEQSKLKANSTSGSTGEKLQFYNDQESLDWRSAIKVRNLRWIGCDVGDPVAVLWGSHTDRRRLATLEGHLHLKLLNRLFLNSFEMSDSTMREYVEALRRFEPVVLTGYPSSLVVFSDYLRRTGTMGIGLAKIVTSGESLTQSQREVIETCFGVPVYNRYGCREFGDIAYECPAGAGLHINAERVIVEFEPLNSGDDSEEDDHQLDKMLITDLDNLGMPFIRYDVGDLGFPGDSSPCACGITLPRIARLDGRSFDVIRAPNGRYVPGVFWTIVSREIPGIDVFQIHQTSPLDLKVTVVPGSDYETERSLGAFRQRILEEMGEQTRIEFEIVDRILSSPEGKRRFVISSFVRS
jgi:phenylacetate-CoA ligase